MEHLIIGALGLLFFVAVVLPLILHLLLFFLGVLIYAFYTDFVFSPYFLNLFFFNQPLWIKGAFAGGVIINSLIFLYLIRVIFDYSRLPTLFKSLEVRLASPNFYLIVWIITTTIYHIIFTSKMYLANNVTLSAVDIKLGAFVFAYSMPLFYRGTKNPLMFLRYFISTKIPLLYNRISKLVSKLTLTNDKRKLISQLTDVERALDDSTAMNNQLSSELAKLKRKYEQDIIASKKGDEAAINNAIRNQKLAEEALRIANQRNAKLDSDLREMEKRYFDEKSKNYQSANKYGPIATILDAYKFFGLNLGEEINSVTAAYKKMQMEYHPDTVAQRGAEIKEIATKKTQQINQAYEILKKHLKYD